MLKSTLARWYLLILNKKEKFISKLSPENKSCLLISELKMVPIYKRLSEECFFPLLLPGSNQGYFQLLAKDKNGTMSLGGPALNSLTNFCFLFSTLSGLQACQPCVKMRTRILVSFTYSTPLVGTKFWTSQARHGWPRKEVQLTMAWGSCSDLSLMIQPHGHHQQNSVRCPKHE